MSLIESVKISSAITPTAGATGTTPITGSTLDMSGFDGVLMIVRMGAITTGALTSIKAQQDSDSAFGSPGDITGSSQTIADTADEKTFYIDLFRPKERYVALYVGRGTQAAVVSSALYIQYNATKEPCSQGDNVAGESFVFVDDGTA